MSTEGPWILAQATIFLHSEYFSQFILFFFFSLKMLFAATWMDLEIIILWWRKLDKDKILVIYITCMWNLLLLSHSVVSDSFATPWTGIHQAPLCLGLSRQEYWSGLPFPPPGDLPDPGIKPASPALAGGFLTIEPPEKPQSYMFYIFYTYKAKSLCCALETITVL